MIKLEDMYQGMPFSPDTYLTKAINEADTEIYINDEAVFPPAPNIATIGNDKDGEVIKYTSLFKGVLSGCTRGVVGTPKSWAINSVIARNYSSEDQRIFIKNILALEENKVNKVENKDLIEISEIEKLEKIEIDNESKITNDITGNAATATKLKTSVNIFGLPFDGSKNLVEDDNHKLVTNAEKIIIREASNPNLLINGDFQVWQRGTEFNTGFAYCTDRWYINGSAKIKKENNTLIIETSNFNGIKQTVEFNDFYKGKFVTLSLNIKTNDPNNFYQVFINDGVSNKAIKLGANNNYEVITTTCKLADNATALTIYIQPTTTNNTILSIKWAKLELGEIATPFIPRPYAEELALCKRYYEKGFYVSQYTGNSVPANLPFFMPVRYTVKKRILPTFTTTSTSGIVGYITGVLDVYAGTGDDIFMSLGGHTSNLQYVGYVGHNPLYQVYHFNWTADAEIY